MSRNDARNSFGLLKKKNVLTIGIGADFFEPTKTEEGGGVSWPKKKQKQKRNQRNQRKPTKMLGDQRGRMLLAWLVAAAALAAASGQWDDQEQGRAGSLVQRLKLARENVFKQVRLSSTLTQPSILFEHSIRIECTLMVPCSILIECTLIVPCSILIKCTVRIECSVLAECSTSVECSLLDTEFFFHFSLNRVRGWIMQSTIM